MIIKNFSESFFFLSKISKRIRNENPEKILDELILKIHKSAELIEYSATTVLNKTFSFLSDSIY